MDMPVAETAKAADPAPAGQPAPLDLPAPAAREALRRMVLIRRFEEQAEEAYMRGAIHGTMHLSIGQEASAVGMCLELRRSDYITSTHRGHGHCIGKGADPRLMFAEFFGKEAGYCRGRGGSMHIADVEGGNLGANGIVGGGLPIAAGAALSIKRQRRDDVVVCFFGDGASNEGAFHEALNMAALWRLPVVFVCENNKYGMSVSTERSMAARHVADRAASYAMPGVRVDGNDLLGVLGAARAAISRARAGDGPTLIECETYRIRGHSRSDRNRYRTREEIEQWRARDPITLFERRLLAGQVLTEAEVDAVRREVEEEIAAAIRFASDAPAPRPEDVAAFVYAEAQP